MLSDGKLEGDVRGHVGGGPGSDGENAEAGAGCSSRGQALSKEWKER